MGETVKEGYSLTHAYKEYKEDCRERGEVYGKVNEHIYRKICKDFNEMLVAEAMTGRCVSFPHYMGGLAVRKQEVDFEKLKIDWGETDKLGKIIYHTNQHSDGFFARWMWKTPWNVSTAYYKFVPVRGIKTRLSKIMKQEGGHKRFFTKH